MAPRRQYSSQEYTERRTFGRDENGEIVVKIEKNPSDPIRPVSPVRPVTPVGDHRHGHLLKPIQPINIPRIDVHSASPSNSPRHRQGDGVGGGAFALKYKHELITMRNP
ncbi:hypothetical protein ANCCEY_03524 [Ancylostoma ceylanicum]|uniref:Uncharacterized protein n=1 Tax=Ancylostoma ceylanicum TaxID=53326 RepID=A0A0D6M4R8_9BILA|nr:hypothetical protein ANCCEY_03524 [Ancylostoma ceylanicum]